MLSGPSIPPESGNVHKIVIFLHGYGATGDDLIDIGDRWKTSLPNTLFISPHAPDVCETSSFGRQWFGLSDFNPTNIRQGLDTATPIVVNYVGQLMVKYKLKSKDIALVGFSQGSILALDMIFHIDGLGGIIGYSGAFYPPTTFDYPQDPPNVLLVHGTNDTVVPYAALLHAQTHLELHGVTVIPHTCNGLAHSINPTGVSVGREYLLKTLTNC